MVMDMKAVGASILSDFGLVMREDSTVKTMSLRGRVVHYNPDFVASTARQHGIDELNFLTFVFTHESLHYRLKHLERTKLVIANVQTHLAILFGNADASKFDPKLANYVYDAEINELIIDLLGMNAQTVKQQQLGLFRVHIDRMIVDLKRQLSVKQLASVKSLLVEGGPGGLFMRGKVHDVYSDLLSQVYVLSYLLDGSASSGELDHLLEQTHDTLEHGERLGETNGTFRDKATEQRIKVYLKDNVVSFKPKRKRAVINPKDLARIKAKLAHEQVATYQRVSRRQYLSPDILKRGRKRLPRKYLVAIDISVSMRLDWVVSIVEELRALDQASFDFTFFAGESKGSMDPVGRIFKSHEIEAVIPLVQMRDRFHPYSSQESFQFERYDEHTYKFIVVAGDFEYGMEPEFRGRTFDEAKILNVRVPRRN